MGPSSFLLVSSCFSRPLCFFAPGAPESVMGCAHFRALLLGAQCTGNELEGVFRWTTKSTETRDLLRWTCPSRVCPEPCCILAIRRGSYGDAGSSGFQSWPARPG